MPKTAQDRAVVDLLIVDDQGETVLRIRKQTISSLENYALTRMGRDLHVAVVSNGYDTPEAYAE